MSGTQLAPEKITSPFQLMAAWFAMLVLIVSVLLTAAGNIEKPEWAAGYLITFSSVVILVVISCVLLMLTKYRPHLQDGKEYAEWIKDQGVYSSGYIKKLSVSPASEKQDLMNLQPTPATTSINNVLVSVIDALGSVNIVETLKNQGFNAEIYESKYEKNKSIIESIKGNHEGLWIGKRIDPKVAIKAIKTALNIWPELKYIHLASDKSDPPDYVNDQIFIGGATSSAIRAGTKEWRIDELLSLDENMSLNDFHKKIREKYS